jgi:NAD(P)-dependent dehydrogenase (short-subunit alcohol dehydrogenase family)
MESKKTVIVTGASQGIGAAIVQAFLDRGYDVVATSRSDASFSSGVLFCGNFFMAIALFSKLVGLSWADHQPDGPGFGRAHLHHQCPCREVFSE